MGNSCCKMNYAKTEENVQDLDSQGSFKPKNNEKKNHDQEEEQNVSNSKKKFYAQATFGGLNKQEEEKDEQVATFGQKSLSQTQSIKMDELRRQKTPNISLKQKQNSITNPFKKSLSQKSNTMKSFTGEHKNVFIKIRDGEITEKYSILQEIGEGGLGKVYKVIHVTTGLIRERLDQQDLDSMYTEIEKLLAIDHPNITKFFETYQDENNLYLISEYLINQKRYCEGGELLDNIRKLSQFSEKIAANILSQILSAVTYCHKLNIIHRDIKPENILMLDNSNNFKIKIIDYGTSRKFQSVQQVANKAQIPFCVAPEVFKMEFNEKCDVWSCGVILYLLLCGYPPFNGKTELEIQNNILIEELKFPDNEWKYISKGVKDLLIKMLQKDFNVRISSAEAQNNPWIVDNAPDHQIDNRVLDNLQQFQTIGKFRSMLMGFIASQIISNQEKEELQKQFQKLDKNGDGKIQRDELIFAYYEITKSFDLAQIEVDKILKHVDINNSGEIDFSEFIMAVMNHEQIMNENKISTAFKLMDVDCDGFICKNDMEQALGCLEEDIWVQFVQECNAQFSEKISMDEFIKLLLKRK